MQTFRMKNSRHAYRTLVFLESQLPKSNHEDEDRAANKGGCVYRGALIGQSLALAVITLALIKSANSNRNNIF